MEDTDQSLYFLATEKALLWPLDLYTFFCEETETALGFRGH